MQLRQTPLDSDNEFYDGQEAAGQLQDALLGLTGLTHLVSEIRILSGEARLPGAGVLK